MTRATTGMVAAYVWDYAEGMQLMRVFWDAAVALDPDAPDEGPRFPLCRPEELRAAFTAAGLVNVEVEAIVVPTPFRDFDDFWQPFLGGQGAAPAYLMSLPEEHREALRAAAVRGARRRPDRHDRPGLGGSRISVARGRGPVA